MKKALSAAEAKSITEPGSHRAGETLYLRVAPSGSKSWVQRLTIHGRRCDIGLGGYPLVSLAKARDKALQEPHEGAGWWRPPGGEAQGQDADVPGRGKTDL